MTLIAFYCTRQSRAPNEGRRSNSLARRAWTHRRTLPSALSPCFAKAMWSIITCDLMFHFLVCDDGCLPVAALVYLAATRCQNHVTANSEALLK